MKAASLGAELFPTDGQMDRRTDVANITVDFRNFAKASKNSVFSVVVMS
jgi:hypothetical protein